MKSNALSYMPMTQDQAMVAIGEFGAALQQALGTELNLVAVYGSLVKGGYDPVTSDHNVFVLLKRSDARVLRVVAETMRSRRPSRRTGLLLLEQEELAGARDVFPLKIRDLIRHHKVVSGEGDPFVQRSFAPADLRRDCEQQLRSLAIRLRRLSLKGFGQPGVLRSNLLGSFRGFLPPMAGLIELSGEPEPPTKDQIIVQAAALLGVSAQPLTTLHEWTRDGSAVSQEGEVNTVLNGYVETLRAAIARVDQLRVT